MLKQKLFKFVVALALLATAAGSIGIVADSLGLALTPAAYACPSSGSSGGGC